MADPFSSRTYLGDGTNAVFSVPFPYLEKAHVHVFVNGVETTGIQWLSSNSIRLTSTPAAGDKVKIMRQTPKDARTVDFQNGTNFVEADLDKSADQTFYIVQEAYDSLTTLIQQDNTGKWDALGVALQNLGDPVNPQDAATKGWVLSVPNTTLAAGLAAQQAAELARDEAKAVGESLSTIEPRFSALEATEVSQEVTLETHSISLADHTSHLAALQVALDAITSQVANASSIGESLFLHSNCGGF